MSLPSKSIDRSPPSRPYSPSWFDRLKTWVDILPGPWWIYYLALGVFLLAAHALLEWQLGIFPFNITNPYFFLITSGSAYIIAFTHFIDRAAGRALDEYRPALDLKSEAEYAVLYYRLTTLPALPTLLASFLGSAFVVIALFVGIVPFQLLRISSPPVWQWFNALIEIVLWFVNGMFIYHTFRQLLLVRRIYDRHTRINLFKIGPLYALSGLTARTAIGVGIIAYGALVSAGQNINPAAKFTLGTLSSVGILLCFLVPLLGIHRRLTQEKERVLTENMTRLEKLVAETQNDIDNGRTDRATALRDQTNTVQMQYQILKKIPTWPWQPETPRTVITALFIPIVLFFIQFAIQRWIVP